MTAVKLVCGLHKRPRYLRHLGVTGPSGLFGFTYVPGAQPLKHRGGISVRSWVDVPPGEVLKQGDPRIHRMYEVTCCRGPMRFTTETARILHEVGQQAPQHTVDLPAFLSALS